MELVDGRCIFEIVKNPQAPVGYASTLDFKMAANMLKGNCLGDVEDEHGTGGIAANIGESINSIEISRAISKH